MNLKSKVCSMITAAMLRRTQAKIVYVSCHGKSLNLKMDYYSLSEETPTNRAQINRSFGCGRMHNASQLT